MNDEPSPIFPLPPAKLGMCSGCRHRVERLQQQVVMTPQGPVPARFPQWIMQPSEGWCWEWKAAD